MLRALLFCMLLPACTRKIEPPPIIDDGSICNVDLKDSHLSRAAAYCHALSLHDAPILYAHFLDARKHEPMSTEESVDRVNDTIDCAPTPVLLSEGHKDVSGNSWQLQRSPDYFAWHLAARSSIDETIVIADTQGFPVKSQSVKLENELERTLVLMLNTQLASNTRYYLYLTMKTPTGPKRWIQPLTISSTGMVKPVAINESSAQNRK